MRRALVWLLALLLVWAGWVYLYSRPRFWAWLAMAAERTSYGARDLYNRTRADQARRGADWPRRPRHTSAPLPDASDVIDAARYFLQEQWEKRKK